MISKHNFSLRHQTMIVRVAFQLAVDRMGPGRTETFAQIGADTLRISGQPPPSGGMRNRVF